MVQEKEDAGDETVSEEKQMIELLEATLQDLVQKEEEEKLHLMQKDEENTDKEIPADKQMNEAVSDDKFNDLSMELFQAIRERRWDEAMEHVQHFPQLAEIFVQPELAGKKCLPIHEACAHQPPHDIIAVLIGVYPDGVRQEDSEGKLPLHHAFHGNAHPSIAQTLLLAYPDAIDMLDQSEFAFTSVESLASTSLSDDDEISTTSSTLRRSVIVPAGSKEEELELVYAISPKLQQMPQIEAPIQTKEYFQDEPADGDSDLEEEAQRERSILELQPDDEYDSEEEAQRERSILELQCNVEDADANEMVKEDSMLVDRAIMELDAAEEQGGLQDEVNFLQKELEKVQADLTLSAEREKLLGEATRTVKSVIDEGNKEMEEIKSQLEAKNKSLQEYVDSLTKKQHESEEEKLRLEKEKEGIEVKNRDLNEKICELKEMVALLKEEKTNNNESNSECLRAKEQKRELETECNNLREKLNSIDTNANESQEEASNGREVESLKREIESLQSSLSTYKKESSAKRAALEKQLFTLANDSLKVKKLFDNRVMDYEQKKKALKEDREKITMKVVEMEDMTLKLKAKIMTKDNEIIELKQNLKQEKAARAAEKFVYLEEKEAMKAEIKRVKEGAAKKKEAVLRLVEGIEKEMADMKRLYTKKIKTQSNEIDGLKEELENIKTTNVEKFVEKRAMPASDAKERNAHEAEISALKELKIIRKGIDEYKTKHDDRIRAKDEEIRELKCSRADLEGEVAKLSKELTVQKNEIEKGFSLKGKESLHCDYPRDEPASE